VTDLGDRHVREGSPRVSLPHLDELGTQALLARITGHDHAVPDAVARVLPDVATAVNLAVGSLRNGGRIRYVGAGTSGRIGVLDAAELPPTFGISPYLISARIAGGDSALRMAIEGAEDLEGLGRDDVADLAAGDVLIALTASGTTPYARGALAAAQARGVHAVLLTTTPGSPLTVVADISLIVDVGEEVLAGSTRLKAGTAQKLVLNAFSTAVLVRLGHTYRSRMIDVIPSNDKLRSRAITILAELTGAQATRCAQELKLADGSVKTALVALLAGCSAAEATAALGAANGYVDAALETLRG